MFAETTDRIDSTNPGAALISTADHWEWGESIRFWAGPIKRMEETDER